MADPPAFGFGAAVGRWTFNPAVAAVLVLLGVLYLLGVLLARRSGVWPWWRVGVFLVGGLGGAAVCTMSSLAVDNHAHLWALATQVTLLVSLVPLALGLGEPIGLLRACLNPDADTRLGLLMQSAAVRVLTFPLVAAALATGFLLVVFFSPLLSSALHHPVVMDGSYLAALAVGCLTSLPLLGAELLPAWCTDPFRLLFAFIDGLIDALPGILVLTTGRQLADGYFAGRADDPNWDVHVAGALMLTLSELVALPIFFVVFFRWAAHEGAFAPSRPAQAGRVPTARAHPPEVTAPELMRPWWETEDFRGRGRDA